MLKLQLARADNNDFYLALPATPAEVGEVWSWMDEISADVSSTRIVGAISDVWGIGSYLKSTDMNDPEQMKKLNRIGKIVNGLPGEKYRLLEGALKAESVSSLDDVIDIGEHLEKYLLIEGVASDRELGGYLVGYGIMPFDERVRPYLDYDRIGREYYANHSGAYTAGGYVIRRDSFEPEMDAHGGPEYGMEL